jgi:hypothetical protein
MIYMIEIDYADPATEGEWDAWYHTYVRDLVTIPGIATGQRFVAASPTPYRHLAVYTLQSLSVYDNPRYREIGGGGKASAKWRSHIRRRRNLFNGMDWVPEAAIGETALLVTEQNPQSLDLRDVLFARLDVVDMEAIARQPGSALRDQVPFDGKPEIRYVAMTPLASARALGLAERSDVAVYEPSGGRVTGAS